MNTNHTSSRTSASRTAHVEVYRGYTLEIVHVTRTNHVLMDSEFIVFIGNDPMIDELESLTESIERGRRLVDQFIAATKG